VTGGLTEPDERIRVVLADNHVPTRTEIRLALEEDSRFEIVGEASDASGAIDAAIRERPDVCLLDINMPGGGIAAAWEITARLPQVKVVMLTVSTDDRDLFAALKAGAAGYLLKGMDPRELPRALAGVVRGEAAIAPALLGRVITEFRDRSARRRTTTAEGAEAQLTSREWQVLELLGGGRPAKRRSWTSAGGSRARPSRTVPATAAPVSSAWSSRTGVACGFGSSTSTLRRRHRAPASAS
jgi:DNA-binding NarL/FixJ family response regulator